MMDLVEGSGDFKGKEDSEECSSPREILHLSFLYFLPFPLTTCPLTWTFPPWEGWVAAISKKDLEN